MSAKSRRWLRVAKFVAYPMFYLLCLGFFGYLSFPWDQLKDRLISEFNKSQAKQGRPGEKPMRLEIDELDSYWFSGVEISGARLIIPPKPKRPSARTSLGAFGKSEGEEEKPPTDSVLHLKTITARVRLLSLLTGDVVVDFDAEAFGGTISGTVPVGPTGDDVEIEFAGLELLQVQPLQAVLQGVPLQGVADGSLRLTPKEGKFAKADGGANFAISGLKIGNQRKNDEGVMEDVVEIQGIAIPSVVVGTLNIEATAKDGTLTFAELAAKSPDFELQGDGNVKLNEAWDRSRVEMFLKFKFTDAYRTKSAAATALLGKPGDANPLIELSIPDIKRSKTEDGFYRFRIHGSLGSLDFDPAGTGGAAGRSPRASRRTTAANPRTPRAARRGAQPDSDGDDGDADAATKRPTPRPRRPMRRTPPPSPEPVAEPEPAAEDPTPEDPPAEEPPAEDPPQPEDAPDDTPGEDAPVPEDGGGEGG